MTRSCIGLYQFTGVKGKKALVLLTDGKDTASKFEFDTMLEYVKKSGISVYAIGFKICGADLEVKYKLNKLAQVTGGQTFYMDYANHLEAVYKQINEELRSQYFLTYYSTQHDGQEGQVAQDRGQGRASQPPGADDQRVLPLDDFGF